MTSSSDPELPNIPSQPHRRNVLTSLSNRLSKRVPRKFKYKPLDLKRNEIRLLRLFPGSLSSPVYCSLAHVSMHDEPVYGALSYEWADRGDPETIYVDNSKFSITRNLKAALLRLRSNRHDRVLWIDALCIDQWNIGERNEQVTKMIEVYRAAEIVIIWAGQATINSSLAISCVRRHHGKAEDEFHPSPEEITAVENLFDRSYWYRAWVVQEVISAKKALVCCGIDFVDWIEIKPFYSMCFNNFMIGNPAPEIESLHGFFLAPDDDEAFPLHAFRDRKATDERDYIFAFVGLIPELQNPTFVDYSQSVEEVYKKSAILLIEETQRIDQILFAVPDKGNNFDLPSWVPDWSQLPLSGLKDLSGRASPARYSASRNSKAEIRILGDVLRCKGFRIGAVAKLGVPCPWTREWKEPLLQTFLSWQELLKTEFTNEQDFQPPFVRQCLQFLHADYPRLYGIMIGLSKIILPEHPIPSHLEKYLIHEIGPTFERNLRGEDYQQIILGAANIFGRRLMISSNQDIGLVVNETEVGDVVCILLGCSYPVILRPKDEGFKLVSFAMLDGFMEGEAMAALAEGKHELRDFDIV